jgi:hypothetical protein
VVTYLQLAAEPEWQDEKEAPAHAALAERLRREYGHTRSQTGSKGDNNHLRGGHRSRNWILGSRYCTDRVYTVTDARDRAGDGDWLRATDVGIQDATLRAASSRLDQAVRAGRLPCVAEWFGTIDGQTVVGWYEGHPSTADDSHLYHLHFRLWTGSCNDAGQLQLLGDTILGKDEDVALSDADAQALIWRVEAIFNNRPATTGGPLKGEVNQLHIALGAAASSPVTPEQLAELATAAGAGAKAGAADAIDGAVIHAEPA